MADGAAVEDSTLSHNTAGTFGGALYAADATVGNSTLTENSATTGGAVNVVAGPLELAHATIVGNSGSDGANLSHDGMTSFASVVADSQGGGSDCDSDGSASTHSFSSDDSCGFDDATDTEDGGSPVLGALRDNGGPTPTMFPLIGSPLPDEIPVGDCDGMIDADQRGVARPYGSGCDLGAIEGVFPAHDFTGVGPFYEPTVRWITSNVQSPPLMTGFDNGTFRQNDNLTRAQAVRLYYRAFGEPNPGAYPPHGLSDVPAWVQDAVRWAVGEGIFTGYQNGTFRPNAPINRGNYTRSLYQAVGAPDVLAYPPHGFDDVIPFWEDAVRWAVHHGLANGFTSNETYRPRNNITRGDAARIFYNTNRAPDAWADPLEAPYVTLFQENT